MKRKTNIVGIVNITKDSFSDGRLFLKKDNAIAKGKALFKEGASIIDIGAQSTHPDSKIISSVQELSHLLPVINALREDNIPISIDSYKEEVIKSVLGDDISMLNDVSALHNVKEDTIEALQTYNNVKIVLMHSISTLGKDNKGKAQRRDWISSSFMDDIILFFDKKLNHLVKRGLKENRFILDPGMGFFLSTNPYASLAVLKQINELKVKFNRETYISISRKSFIGTLLDERPVLERQAGTLAAEIHAFISGVDYIRTHDVKALSDAIKITKAIEEA